MHGACGDVERPAKRHPTLRPIGAPVGEGANSELTVAARQACAMHSPRMGKSVDSGQFNLNQCSRRPSLEACDTQNLGHNLAHVVEFPMLYPSGSSRHWMQVGLRGCLGVWLAQPLFEVSMRKQLN
jgi:hypothetical protein